MKLASYNVENLFDRARVMNLENWADGRQVLEHFARANDILGQQSYDSQDKGELARLLIALGLEKSDENKNVILRRNRGELLKRPRSGGIEIVANGRIDWVGSLELKESPVDHESMLNTGRVMADLDADVLGVVEAENRPALSDFNRDILGGLGGQTFHHVMLIDGNDTRGIDVGLLTKRGFPIVRMASHVDDKLPNGENVFSRDCPEYEVRTKNGNTLFVLVNHFKSKGYGPAAASERKRIAQAERVLEIVEELSRNQQYVAVVGDLNDTPNSAAIQALIRGGVLKETWTHPNFDDGGHDGTYGAATANNKIDYILLSVPLYDKMRAGGVVRTGMWPGKRPKWPAYPSIKEPVHAASDHAALWVELDI